ncbi:MAG: FG-GAP-like repeat-containing protein [Actinomycetota bacterium]
MVRRRRGHVAAALLLAVVATVVPLPAGAQVIRPTPPAIENATDGYWMLDADGWVYAFGAAVDLGNPSALMEDRRALDLVEHPGGRGYWVLADDGAVYAFGEAPYLGGGLADVGLLPGERAATMSATPSGNGYWIFTDAGRAVVFGDAVHHGDLVELGLGASLNGPIVDAVAQPDGSGYYLVGTDGGVFAFGTAAFAGSMGSISLNAPVNGLVPDEDGVGYRLVASDGGVFAFGADFRGSMGSVPLNAPVVGMIAYGDGYLMVASDGGIFNFSNRDFVGSLGGQAVPAPVVDVAGVPESGPTGDGAALPPGTQPGDSVPVGPGVGDPPVASMTITPSSASAATVSFDGRASFDPDGTILSWHWDFGDGFVGTGPTVDHTYTAPGRYLVLLTVSDDDGRAALVFDHVDIAGPVSFQRLSTEGGTFPEPPEHRDQTLALTADLSGDGIDDIVMGGRRGARDSMVWFERTSTGWTRHTIESDSLRIEAGGAAADIDGDGDLDLVAGGDTTDDRLWWWENPGRTDVSRWTRRVIKDGSGNQHHDQLFADIDGDGRLELAFWNQKDGNALRVAEIPTDPRAGEWPSTVIFRGASVSEGLASADIDGDGVVDLVGGGHWFSSDGDGTYTTHEIDAAMSATRVVAGQFAVGGRPEVVFESGDAVGPFRIYEWDGAAWVGRDLADEDSDHGHTLEAGDVNGDGHLDLLAAEMRLSEDADPQVRVLYGDGLGGFETQVVAGGVGIHEGRLADVDGDGDLDIVGKPLRPDDPSMTVWLNTGPSVGWHRHVPDEAIPYRTVFVRHGDVDGDGLPDLLTGAWWWRNPGVPGGAWERNEIGGDLRQVYVVDDVDGDGDLDVIGGDATGSGWDGDLRWAENDGDGDFTVRSNIERADGALVQGAIIAELVPGVRQLLLSFNDGVGGLQAVTIPPANAVRTETWQHSQLSPTVVGEELALGDFDDDGDIDVFDGEAWFGNNGGALTRLAIVSIGAGEPDRVRAIDVDGDGDLDTVVGFGHDDQGRVRWYEQGNHPAIPWTEHVIDDLGAASPLSLDAGDLDGDGDVDLVVGEHTNPAVEGLRLIFYERVGDAFVARAVEAGDEHHDGTQLVDLDLDGDLDVVSIGWLHRRLLIYEQVG